MSPLKELLAMVEGMEEHPDDYREVRAMKRLAQTIEHEDAA